MAAADLSPALSEDYSDIIVRQPVLPGSPTGDLEQYFPQPVNNQYTIFHAPLSDQLSTIEEIGYSSVPKLFTSIDTVSLEASGILAVQIQPFLRLNGEGVLVGFIDSGIDYTHPAFRNADGTTRILRIWDQNDTRGTAPAGISYGTEFTQEDINAALFSSPSTSPESGQASQAGQAADIRAEQSLQGLIPERDPLGHGTAVAGIACGTAEPAEGFTGAAPQSSIAFVRLKPAKQYLRDYFLIPGDAIAYQENDLMLGVRYLVSISRELGMPLVICITVGTNQGGHSGLTPLEEVLNAALYTTGVCAVTGTGNEAGRGHHYFGQLSHVNESTDVELLVDQETQGFTIEFWADAPELYSLGFTSPLGETIEPIQPRNGTTREFSFLLENSRIFVTYAIIEALSGAQLVLLRFYRPTPGIWRIRIINRSFLNGAFHMWLPITGLVDPMIRFYSPNADTTLVIPSCAQTPITVSTWNAYNNSLYINSGRGFTRNGLIKPDFASPGVDVTCPAPGGGYSSITGSCAGSAMAAGAAALLLEAGLRQDPPRSFTASELKSLFLRGTVRNDLYTWPNREWGYGMMNVYGIFESYLKT